MVCEILRQLLIDAKVVIMPGVPSTTIPFVQEPGDGSTLCFAGRIPDEPDQCLIIQDVDGKMAGRVRNKYLIHPGVRIVVRALPPEDVASALAQSIANALDKIQLATTITADKVTHYVQTVYRIGTIKPLGEEVGRNRFLFIINARIAFQDKEPSLG